jgi:hypothetical protein
MSAIRTVPVVDGEFWAVVLADPDLLDEAFAEVMASWHAGLPPSSPGTLAGNSDRANPVPPKTQAGDWQPSRNFPAGAAPRPQVARSPPR